MDCGTVQMSKPTGAQFEILVDVKPRSYRDTLAIGLQGGRVGASHIAVVVRDLRSGELTTVTYKPER
jgi:hypothetical protein